MGDRTAFQCAMIYNDQKDSDWFRPTLSQYGRTKRRATATNKQQRFLSSATAVPPRPQSADKPPKGVHLDCTRQDNKQLCLSVLVKAMAFSIDKSKAKREHIGLCCGVLLTGNVYIACCTCCNTPCSDRVQAHGCKFGRTPRPVKCTEMHWNASRRLFVQSCKHAEVKRWSEAIVAAVAGC